MFHGEARYQEVMIKVLTYVILLVFVVGHDGDDGVVDEESQGQDSCQAREGRPAQSKGAEIKEQEEQVAKIMEHHTQGAEIREQKT